MNRKLLLFTFLITATLTAMQQDGGDPVKKGLYYLFNVPRHYDALHAYDPTLSRHSRLTEMKKSYKKLLLKFHPDKNNGETREDTERINEDFKKFEAAFGVFKSNATQGDLEKDEAFVPKTISKEEYDLYLNFIDVYSVGIKTAAVGIALYSCWLAYQWGKNNLGSSPKSTLNQLYSSTHTTVDRLLAIRFDRYVHSQADFSLAKQVNVKNLCKRLSADLSGRLGTTIAQADETLAKAYTKIAWGYYDCQSMEEIKSRDPLLVEELLVLQKSFDEIIDECKRELGIESFATSLNRLTKPVAGIAGLLVLSSCWMSYKKDGCKELRQLLNRCVGYFHIKKNNNDTTNALIPYTD